MLLRAKDLLRKSTIQGDDAAVMVISQDITQEELDNIICGNMQDTDGEKLARYIKNHILRGRPLTYSKVRMAFDAFGKIALGGFGIFYGLPWAFAGAKAAVIFPDGLWRQVFAKIYFANIVVVVGAEGLWVMAKLSEKFSGNAYEEKKLLNSKNISCDIAANFKKSSKLILSFVLASLSSISPVYAILAYSEDNKLLPAITLVNIMAHGVYGYSKLIDLIINYGENLYRRVESNKKELHAIKMLLLKNIRYQLTLKDGVYGKLHNFADDKSFVNYLVGVKAVDEAKLLKIARSIFINLPAILIPGNSSVTNFFLAKEALSHIWKNTYFEAIGAIIASLPNFIILFISTRGVFGDIYRSPM